MTDDQVEESCLGDGALPDRYEVDEVVAITVDPRTLYVYWEVRPATFARAHADHPSGALAIRVTIATEAWDGQRTETRDHTVEALYGDRFINDIVPGSRVRVSVGYRSEDGFEPLAVGAEVLVPRSTAAKTTAREVRRWTASRGAAVASSFSPVAPPAPRPVAPPPASQEVATARPGENLDAWPEDFWGSSELTRWSPNSEK